MMYVNDLIPEPADKLRRDDPHKLGQYNIIMLITRYNFQYFLFGLCINIIRHMVKRNVETFTNIAQRVVVAYYTLYIGAKRFKMIAYQYIGKAMVFFGYQYYRVLFGVWV